MAFGILARGARIQRFGLIVRKSASANQAGQIPLWPAVLENGRKQSSNPAQLKLKPVRSAALVSDVFAYCPVGEQASRALTTKEPPARTQCNAASTMCDDISMSQVWVKFCRSRTPWPGSFLSLFLPHEPTFGPSRGRVRAPRRPVPLDVGHG
jgi:hypothetical protein